MAYYVLVKDENGEPRTLNISKSKLFTTRERAFKKPNAYTLPEIDLFTAPFEDEDDLKSHLIEEGILPIKYINSPLSISFIKQGKYDGIKYDLLYQDSIEYIMETDRLIERILQRYYDNDFEFIKKLALRFLSFRECQSTAPEIVALADLSINAGKRDAEFNELDKNGDNMILRLIKLLILKHTENPNGTIIYSDKWNYRNLHLLVSFVLNYDNHSETLNQEEVVLPKPEFESKSYTRTRKKDASQVPGQVSFTDLT